MKINETIFALLTDTNTLLESMYQAIADVDPNYAKEKAIYEQGVQALLQAAPSAEEYLQARQREFASDIRFAMWQGFMWNLECHHNPIHKLLPKVLDFEDLCQESQMHALPAAQENQVAARAFAKSLPEDQCCLMDPIIDHFAYLETYGYKLAYAAGDRLANNLRPLVLPEYIVSSAQN